MIKWQEMELADIFDVRDQILTRSDFVRCDDADYLKSITTLNLGEICPDIVLLNHEQAIKENRCIQNSFPNFAACYWKIGVVMVWRKQTCCVVRSRSWRV